MMQVARLRNASWMSSRCSQRMRNRFIPWYQAIMRSTTHPDRAQARTVRFTAAGDTRPDALGADQPAVLVVVVAPVGVEPGGGGNADAPPAVDRRDRVEQR